MCARITTLLQEGVICMRSGKVQLLGMRQIKIINRNGDAADARIGRENTHRFSRSGRLTRTLRAVEPKDHRPLHIRLRENAGDKVPDDYGRACVYQKDTESLVFHRVNFDMDFIAP